MNDTSEAGFNGTVSCGGYEIKVRNGYDILLLKEYMNIQPYNQFFWLRRERELLYRNGNGEFFKMNFEKIEL